MFIRKTLLRTLNAVGPRRDESSKLVVMALAVLMLATTITALTQSTSTSGTRVQLCVKDNGQLRLTATGSSCDPSERLTEWVVGGQVTEIQLGQGLIGNRENGTMSLALDTSIFQSCIGCGKIIAGFNDGPLELPQFHGGEETPPLAKLQLPAGNYAIFAKLVVADKHVEELPVTTKEYALCKLSAGNDFDNVNALLEVEDDRPINDLRNDEVVLTLEVVHRFALAGEAVLACSSFPITFSTPMEVRNLKIVAIEGTSISNSFLPRN